MRKQSTKALNIAVTLAELRDFLDLLVEFDRRLKTPITLTTALSGERVTDPFGEWKAIKEQHVFKTLFVGRELFAPAFRTFCERYRFGSALTEKRRATNLAYEKTFVTTVVFYFFRHLLETESPELIKEAKARTRRQAAHDAKKILSHMEKGARLENIRHQGMLRALLKQYVTENEKVRQKRPRNDRSHAQRLFVKRVARDFLTSFGEPLTSIIVALAGSIKYDVDERIIERIVSKVRNEITRPGRKAITNALAIPHRA